MVQPRYVIVVITCKVPLQARYAPSTTPDNPGFLPTERSKQERWDSGEGWVSLDGELWGKPEDQFMTLLSSISRPKYTFYNGLFLYSFISYTEQLLYSAPSAGL